MLSAGIAGCDKEAPLKTESSTNSNNKSISLAIEPGYYAIHNSTQITDNYKRYAYPFVNDDMQRVMNAKMDTSKFDPTVLWQIEYLDIYKFRVRFLSMNYGFFERQRALDINWNNPNSDGSMDAVIYRKNDDDPGQSWSLVGHIDYNSEGNINRFMGVVVNKRTGKMLQLEKSFYPVLLGNYLIADREFEGSDEEKYYYEHGNFDGYRNQGSTTLWDIRLYGNK